MTYSKSHWISNLLVDERIVMKKPSHQHQTRKKIAGVWLLWFLFWFLLVCYLSHRWSLQSILSSWLRIDLKQSRPQYHLLPHQRLPMVRNYLRFTHCNRNSSFYHVIAMTAGLICSSSPTTSYVYSTAVPSQCFNYTNNTDPTRNLAYTQSINYCDNVSPFNRTTPIWIRFLDPAGIIIPSAPASPNLCGSVATGWYAGQYPSAFFTTATSIVCFFISTNTCGDCSLVSITNCDNFYVFLLPKPNSCNYRYCTL